MEKSHDKARHDDACWLLFDNYASKIIILAPTCNDISAFGEYFL